MTQLLTSSVRVARREWGRLTARRGGLLLTFGVPLVLFPVLAGIYLHGVVREIPVAIFDGDRSELSRLIIRSLDATAAFQIVDYATSVEEIRSGFRRGRIRAAFVIPEGLERDMKRGKRTDIVVYNDATNLVLSNTTLKEASTVVKSVSAGAALKQLRSRGMGEVQAMGAIMPIRVQTQTLYNPTYNYSDYLVTGLVPALFQLTVMISAVLLICGERADGTWADLVRAAEGSSTAIVLGKGIPYLLCHAVTSAAILWILYPLFGINLAGAPLALFLLFLLFVAASFSLGIFISSVVPGRMLATEIALFINIPAFIISGYIYPFRAMPWPYIVFAEILPYTHLLNGFVSVGRMGLPLTDAAGPIGILLLFILAATGASIALVRRRMGAALRAGTAAEEQS